MFVSIDFFYQLNNKHLLELSNSIAYCRFKKNSPTLFQNTCINPEEAMPNESFKKVTDKFQYPIKKEKTTIANNRGFLYR